MTGVMASTIRSSCANSGMRQHAERPASTESTQYRSESELSNAITACRRALVFTTSSVLSFAHATTALMKSSLTGFGIIRESDPFSMSMSRLSAQTL
jgi:hypothetical protein